MTNPNKVNQYTEPDPRQAEFLKAYLNPKSETYSNAYQSAIKVGYSKEYAGNILSLEPAWLLENIDTEKMVEKAMRNLMKLLDEDEDKRILLDTTKFVAERLGKLNEKKDIKISGEIENITNIEEITDQVLTQLKDKKLNGQKGIDKTNGSEGDNDLDGQQ